MLRSSPLCVAWSEYLARCRSTDLNVSRFVSHLSIFVSLSLSAESRFDTYIITIIMSSLSGLFYNETTGDNIIIEEPPREVPWRSIIGASFVVQLVTLSGLGVIAAGFAHRQLTGRNDGPVHIVGRQWTHSIIPSFAAGALIATVVFLLIPEALVLLSSSSSGGHDEHEEDDHSGHNHRWLEGDDDHDDHSDEAGPAWKFGVAFLCGFLFPVMLGIFFPTLENHHADMVAVAVSEGGKVEEEAAQDTTMDEVMVDDTPATQTTTTTTTAAAKEQPVSQEATTLSSMVLGHRNCSLSSSILVGDFLHNFCDGIFVGTAFLLCNATLGWTVVVATVYHEIAQEIADFTILVTLCDFTIVGALAANFVAGFSVVIGAALVAWIDFSNSAVGLILALSSGVYMNIAAVECIPRIQTKKVLALFCFALGAVPIGLVLLNHQHCGDH